ncbi:hypothetical protein AB0870_00405 [Microbacterium proteolyticum]|uniref:hypothetical protein n=1 Tax=Microbacterium proteolyticum TaxID=1572644 RepID=UPI002417AC63|nr:hypothetical protein [Microbacterium proteolyticum]
MNEFLQFAGQYWWLVFPLFGMTMGAIGTVNKQRELSARRRHREQLELIRMQGGEVAASRPAPAVAAPAAGDDLRRVEAQHDDVTHRWLDYELDVSKLIAYPAMSDGRQPLTAAFLRAKKVADNLRPAAGETPSPERAKEYRDAVTDYEVAFELAERDARRVKAAAFTPDERKRLETAQQLLGVAVDQAASPNERQVAYRRVRQELDGLIWLSDEAVENLEKKVALELPSATPPEPAA